MDSLDLQVLKEISTWTDNSYKVVLITIVQTWGSSPRPPGSLLAIREDGLVAGSVSGGCVEDDLIDKIRSKSLSLNKPEFVSYGVTKEEAQKFGLPCGGALKLVMEPVCEMTKIKKLLSKIESQELTTRELDLETGEVLLRQSKLNDSLSITQQKFISLHGPRWRLVIVGAGQLSVYLAQMAQALDYKVIVCDPREEYSLTWNVDGTELKTGMPDDVISDLNLDSRSAVVTLTHDPKIDDMALLEALKSSAFYVGALGSSKTSEKRKERLAMFDLSKEETDKLHGPIGLKIGGKTPPEIAVSILSEMVAKRHGKFLVDSELNKDNTISKRKKTEFV